MCVIYVAEEHQQLLDIWREQNVSSLHVLHLDFHCDMRGLLIDRKFNKAYQVRDPFPGVDQGNFLTHAILEGRVKSIRWVHDEPGGRKYDVGTVKYDYDITALPYRLFNALTGKKGIHIDYKEISYNEWGGLGEGEILDIDWDFFASKAYPVDSIRDRTDQFLNRSFNTVPEWVYICYSPEYSHPSREIFQDFIRDLAELFHAEVVVLQQNLNAFKTASSWTKYIPSSLLSPAKRIYYGMNLGMRKWGIY